MEQREGCSFIVNVCRGRQFVINAIDVVGVAVVTNVQAIGFAIRVQHSEVSIKCAILLHHEDDMAYRIDRTWRDNGNGRLSCCRAAGSGGGCRVGYRRGGSHFLRASGRGQRVRSAVDIVGDYYLGRIGGGTVSVEELPERL